MARIIPLLLFLIVWLPLAAFENYTVSFEGVDDEQTLELLKSISQLSALQSNPPGTLAALRRRAEADIINLTQALQSEAYYTPKITLSINDDIEPVQVTLSIDTGPIYPLTDFRLLPLQDDDTCSPTSLYELVKMKHLGICLGEPAYPCDILAAEEAVLERLNRKGYPFAKIEKRDVVVDQAAKSVYVTLHINSGPLATFGLTTICGQKHLSSRFFEKKIDWCEGDVFTPKKIAKTQEALEASGLFRSVLITPGTELAPDGTLPINIEVSEAKRRSIAIGLNYMTQFGPGITTEWQHRNFDGAGQRLSISADVWQNMQQGTVRIVTPDWKMPKQDLIWLAEYGYERTKGFSESYASCSLLLERQLNERMSISYGGMYKHLVSEHSDNNKSFDLLKVPLQFRWSNANNPLDPTKGMSYHLKAIPTLQMFNPRFFYCINTFTGMWYHSLSEDNRCVLAAKLMLGSIAGASRHEIPPPERFYAGSENTLRGYHFLTVSPLNHKHDPTGGRSMAILSLETRYRLNENFGCAAFYDVGNVYGNSLPALSHKQLQAVGVGLRYYTAIGPLRLDVAFPLNRRKHLDAPLQVYFSIGQSF